MLRIGFFLCAIILYTGVGGREVRMKVVKRTLPVSADDRLGGVNSTQAVVIEDSLIVVNHTKRVGDTGLAAGPSVGVAKSQTRSGVARKARGTSAAKRLLLYLSGYEDEYDWPLQSFSPVRRERRRETSVPILVLPVEDLYLPQSSSTNYNRRKFYNDYEQDDEDEDSLEEEIYGYEYEYPKHRYWHGSEDEPRKPKYGKRPSHEITKTDPRYPIDYSKTRYHTENSKPRYPIDQFESRYPTDNPKPRYPLDSPKLRYPTDNPKQRYPIDNPTELYPADNPKQRYPIDNPTELYPADNPKQRYPTDNPKQLYPADNPNQRYPSENPKQRYSTDSPKHLYPADNPNQRYPTDNPKELYPADNPKQRYPIDNPTELYPADNPKQRYPTDNPKQLYPADNPNQRYPSENPKQRYSTDSPKHLYPADNPNQRYPTDNPKELYPADNSKQRYPTDNPKELYPADNPNQRYPSENPNQRFPTDNPKQRYSTDNPKPQYPTDDGPLPWTESSSPTRRPVAPKPSESVDPNFTLSGSPLELLRGFRNYVPRRSGLPPMVQSQFDISERIILPDDEDDGELNETITMTDANANNSLVYDKEVARPILKDRLKLRGVLTVPRADYSEYYTAWYDPASGDSRIHFHEGSTVTFRKRLADGMIQKTEMHVDRSGGSVVHDCAYATIVPTSRDLQNPALPDMQRFSFSGFEESVGGLIERWEYNVSGRAGEDGGVNGEALTVYHVFLLKREPNEFIRPIRYIVSVDSSILGPDCDGYVHEYLDARIHSRSPTFFEANLDEHCTTVQQLSAASAQGGEEAARLEPLHEFTLPQRDPRYDTIFEDFKATYKRQYINNVEEAVRKNLLMQTTRFVSSGNRAGATFKMAINFLADRSDDEMSKLTGGASAESGYMFSSNIEPFPHPQQSLGSLEGLLPPEFSWKDEGLATEVRHQKKCESCSSIAVTGAVEGALFKRTGQLVQLSEQTIVNCGKKYGVDGCKPAWPNSAYEYVLHEGLPAYKDAPFKDQKEDCSADKFHIITRISGYVNVTRRSVAALKLAIYHIGPVVVVVRSNTKVFQEYKQGVLYDESCSRSIQQHSMLAVGWGVQNGDEYILVKNSYSTMWGEEGYGKFHARSNTCSILNYPTYPRLEERDVVDKIVY